MNGVWTCKALFKAGRLACDVCPTCGNTWRCQNEKYAVIRKVHNGEGRGGGGKNRCSHRRCFSKKMRNSSRGTRLTGNAKELREKLGDENGETDLQQLSLSLNEEEDPKRQYTVTENGTRLVVWTDGSAFHKDMPLVAAAGAETAFARRLRANANFALNAQEGMTNQRGELEACAAVILALDCKLEVRLDNRWAKNRC